MSVIAAILRAARKTKLAVSTVSETSRSAIAGAFLLAACLPGNLALAQESEDVLKVTLNKSALLRLGGSVNTVVIGKSEIADVSMENPRLMLISGKAVGETNLFVLDRQGNEIANYILIVTPEDDRHVTIHRSADALMTYSCSPRCTAIENPTDVIGTQYVPPATVNAAPPGVVTGIAPAPATSGNAAGNTSPSAPSQGPGVGISQ